MQQRDFLQRQLEEIAQVLAVALRYLLGDKNALPLTLKKSHSYFINELNIDIEQLLHKDAEEFISVLQSNNWIEEHYILLAQYLSAWEQYTSNPSTHLLLLQKQLTLYSFIEQSSQTYSFARQQKIASLKRQLMEQ